MSNEATVEIKKIDGKRNIRSEVINFYFGDWSGISPVVNGNKTEINTLVLTLPGGDADYLAAYWYQNRDKIYPEMIIKGKFSSGTNGTKSRAVFTFNEVKINGYGTDKDSQGEFIFNFKIEFEKGSYVLDATASVLK